MKNFSIIIGLSFLFMSCNDNESMIKSEPKSYLITASDYVSNQLVDRFNKNENIEITQDSTTNWEVEYSFQSDDTLSQRYIITSILNIEKTKELATDRFSSFILGLDSAIHISAIRYPSIKVQNLDSLLSFGDHSKFIGLKVNNELIGYFFLAKCGRLLIKNSVISNEPLEHVTKPIENQLQKINNCP